MAQAASFKRLLTDTTGVLRSELPDFDEKVDKGTLVLNVKDYGAAGNGIADDTAAIVAALAAASAGDVIYFPSTGSSAFYRISSAINITKANIVFRGAPRDAYAVSIRCTMSGVTMLVVKAPGFVLQDIGLVGNGGAAGVGATVNGVDLYGDTDGNIDSDMRGAGFLNLATPVRIRGRNATVDDACIFTASLRGVLIQGKDSVYHTGPNADQNRGHYIGGRYHAIGVDATTAAIEVDSTAKLLHAVIAPRLIDSNGKGRHIVLTGTSANPCKGVTILPGKHTETSSDVIVGTYLWNSVILSRSMLGDTTSSVYGSALVLNNANNVDVVELSVLQMGNHGIKMTNSTEIRLVAPKIKIAGLNPTGGPYHGIDVDSTNSNIQIIEPFVSTVPGYGFTGSPTGPLSALTGGRWVSCTTGNVLSTTIANHAVSGLNRYAEGMLGRAEDRASKAFDFVAATARDVATVTGGGNFSSFIVKVRFTARAGGQCHVVAERIVYTENGSPTFVTVGTDITAAATVAFATNGTSSIKVTITPTNAAYGIVQVEAAAGGAANSTNPRGATVVML